MKYEYFCDESYYDMWAVRAVGCKNFCKTQHVKTKEEAIELVKKLERNKMNRITKNTPIILHYHTGDGNYNRGGATIVYDPNKQAFGVALCSWDDNFSKKIGRKLAFERLEKGTIAVVEKRPETIEDVKMLANIIFENKLIEGIIGN